MKLTSCYFVAGINESTPCMSSISQEAATMHKIMEMRLGLHKDTLK